MPGNNDAAAEHHDHHGPTAASAQYHPPPPPLPITKPNTKLLSLVLKALIMSLLTSLFFLFLGVAAIVLLHLCLAGRHFHRSHRRRRHQTPHNSDVGSANDVGYSCNDLRKLPRFRYVPGTKSSVSPAECVVCLENFREGDLCRSLPGCGHVFHSSCIDSWLVKVPACPLCRARVRFNLGASGSVVGAEEFKQIWAVGV